MGKHNVGDRRIVSVSIPEDVAQELDRWTGGGLSLIHISEPTRLV